MGATWHSRSMFNLQTIEDNFKTLLLKHNIEPYWFDIVGSEQRTGTIGNQHDLNVDCAAKLIEEHSIDYVMGYSYGAIVAADVVLAGAKVKGLILLDPYSGPQHETQTIDNGDKKVLTKISILQELARYKSKINKTVVRDYLKNLTPEAELVTAHYPDIVARERRQQFLSKEFLAELSTRLPMLVVFTSMARPEVKEKFPKETIKEYPDSTHWILLEEGRFKLANDVKTFIEQTQ